MTQCREYSRSALASEAKINLETIRFFEKIGLMPDPPRTAAGYRVYSVEHLKRLKFIRRTKELGFTNKEVSSLLDMVDGSYACDDVKDIALNHATLIADKMADLAKMKTALETMASECRGGSTPDCAVIDQLFEA